MDCYGNEDGEEALQRGFSFAGLRLKGKVALEAIRSASAAPGLSILAAQAYDRAAEPCVVPDVTYIPMRRGFLYRVAIMLWATRKVLAWRRSNTDGYRLLCHGAGGSSGALSKPEIF